MHKTTGARMNRPKQPLIDLVISLFSAIALGAVIAAFSAKPFAQGWLAAGVLSFVCLYLLLLAWRKLTGGKTLALLMLVTFVVRLGMGIFIYAALPQIGYDTPVQNAGYFYSDAFNRDQTAWQLAAGDESLLTAFTNYESVDQYGGLLYMSSLVYRILSVDAIRPLLIVLLGAFAMTLGAGFLYSAIQKRWSQKIALLAVWIYALYPDSILLGSAQMREPFLIGLACIGFWAVMQWQGKPLRAAIVTVLSMAVACVISVAAGAVVLAVLTAFFLLEWTSQQKTKFLKALGYCAMAILAVCAVIAGWLWLKNTLYFDAYTTKILSGWITKLMEQYGDKWNIPFTTVYGLTQPLLPAAIFEPSQPIWYVVAIVRSLAWYAALPLLLFGLFEVWKADKKQSKWGLTLLYVVFAVWVVVSSARAGGDLWDNPRYRYILMPFLTLILAWAIVRYRETRSPWLWRWTAAIVVFLGFFFYFYTTRYVVGIIPHLPFLWMIAAIVVIDFLLLAGSLVWDAVRRRKKTG
jgi:hypothetical protein